MPRAAKSGAPAPHGFDDHPSPDADADPDPDGAVAVDEQLAGVWRQQNPETFFFSAAVIEGVRELAAAEDALVVDAAKVAAKACCAKGKRQGTNAREAKGAKAVARAAAKAERRAAKKREHERPRRSCPRGKRILTLCPTSTRPSTAAIDAANW